MCLGSAAREALALSVNPLLSLKTMLYLKSWTRSGKIRIRNAHELTMASGSVGTSLCILLSQIDDTAQVRYNKVVHAFIDAYWAY